MDKALIIERLEMLISLIEETESDIPSERQLFSNHIITVNEMLEEVRISTDGSTLTRIMRQANRIWRIRKMIYNGEWDSVQEAELYDGIQDLLEQKAKIAAIKYYRNTMLNVFKEEVKLRDAKDYVDKIESDLKDRGIIK